MDISVKEENAISDLDQLDIDLESVFDPIVKVEHEEIMLDDNECDLEINLKREIGDYETSQMQNLESHIQKHMQDSILLSSDHISDPRVKMEAEESLLPNLKPKNSAFFQKILKCKLCNYKTLQNQRYQAHIRTHNNGVCFKCSKCDFITLSEQNLRCHKIKHGLKCDVCRYIASSEYNLNLHMKIHIPRNTNFKCDKCPFESIHRNVLSCHRRKHFNKVPYTIYTVLGKDDQNLSDINLNFDSIKHEERLKKVDMPFKCKECSYKTLRQDYLDRHIVFHHKDKLFRCSECEQKFALQRSLLLHVKNHIKQD